MTTFLWACVVWFGLSALMSALLIATKNDPPWLKAARIALFVAELAMAAAAWSHLPADNAAVRPTLLTTNAH